VTGTTLVARATLVTGTTLVARATLVTGTTLVARATLVTGTTLVATLRGAALVDTARVAAPGLARRPVEAGVDPQTGFVDVSVGRQPGNVDIDADGRCHTGSGERGACGDHRTRGYPRDAYSRLLGHLLLPPVAVLVSGAAICGPRLCGVRSERRHIESWPYRPPPFTPVPDIRMLP
ncbi:hypothetical protein, partial [Streptomyces sp. NPDC056308]|uniref:hypothetical protein n=1 Tax=Streptomyces sp. NPDC056308 TaxID=3345780 RepID=UPI0035DABA9C